MYHPSFITKETVLNENYMLKRTIKSLKDEIRLLNHEIEHLRHDFEFFLAKGVIKEEEEDVCSSSNESG